MLGNLGEVLDNRFFYFQVLRALKPDNIDELHQNSLVVEMNDEL